MNAPEPNPINSFTHILNAIDYCLEKHLIMPALILIYSAIDSASWFASEDDARSVGERFQSWVDDWMLCRYPLPCTAQELYAARCGVLHALSPSSDLSNKKGVRIIVYTWGKAQQQELSDALKLLNRTGVVGVHINDIFHSFQNGFADFVESLENDKAKKDLFNQRASKHFVDVDPSVVSQFLDLSKRSTG